MRNILRTGQLTDQEVLHVLDVVDATPQLSLLPKVVDADEQSLLLSIALRVLEVKLMLAMICSLEAGSVLNVRWRRPGRLITRLITGAICLLARGRSRGRLMIACAVCCTGEATGCLTWGRAWGRCVALLRGARETEAAKIS
mgnify:CR=1 FL=1